MPRRNRSPKASWTPQTGRTVRLRGGRIHYLITSPRFGVASPRFLTQHRQLALRVSGTRAVTV